MRNLIYISILSFLVTACGVQSDSWVSDDTYYKPGDDAGKSTQQAQPRQADEADNSNNYAAQRQSDNGTNYSAERNYQNDRQARQAQEREYETTDQNFSSSSGNQVNNTRPYNDYEDFQYTNRIRRFNNPVAGINYYDPFFRGYSWYNPYCYDPFFYDPWGPGFGTTIYNRPGFSVGIGFGWGRPMGWNRWNRWNRGGWGYDPFYNPYLGWGNPYWNRGPFYDPYWGNSGWAYRNGFNDGFRYGNAGVNNTFVNNNSPDNSIINRYYGRRTSVAGNTGTPRRDAGNSGSESSGRRGGRVIPNDNIQNSGNVNPNTSGSDRRSVESGGDVMRNPENGVRNNRVNDNINGQAENVDVAEEGRQVRKRNENFNPDDAAVYDRSPEVDDYGNVNDREIRNSGNQVQQSGSQNTGNQNTSNPNTNYQNNQNTREYERSGNNNRYQRNRNTYEPDRSNRNYNRDNRTYDRSRNNRNYNRGGSNNRSNRGTFNRGSSGGNRSGGRSGSGSSGRRRR